MRFSLIALLVMFSGSGWSSNLQFPSGWAERALDLGIDSALVVLGYSLTDGCELANVEIIENSNPELFGADLLSNLTKVVIGPFDTDNHEVVLVPNANDQRVETQFSTRRLINWRTEFGHRFVACYLDSNSNLVRAEFIDGHMPPAKVAEDKPVRENLSELGTMKQEVEFKVEE